LTYRCSRKFTALCLDKAFKWVLHLHLFKYDIRELFELADDKFFKIFSCIAEHCLNSLLPAKRDLFSRAMRSRRHDFQLPQTDTTLFKNTFSNTCLFKFLWNRVTPIVW
jgi:hypothetical protein